MSMNLHQLTLQESKLHVYMYQMCMTWYMRVWTGGKQMPEQISVCR